jgi:hypothetical protein
VGEDSGISGVDLPDGTTRIFFLMGLDDPNQLELVHEFALLAHALLRLWCPTSDARALEFDLIYLSGLIRFVVDRCSALSAAAIAELAVTAAIAAISLISLISRTSPISPAAPVPFAPGPPLQVAGRNRGY